VLVRNENLITCAYKTQNRCGGQSPSQRFWVLLNFRFLAKYDQENDENPLLGIILCAGKKSRTNRSLTLNQQLETALETA
jgi:hypothetical protein